VPGDPPEAEAGEKQVSDDVADEEEDSCVLLVASSRSYGYPN